MKDFNEDVKKDMQPGVPIPSKSTLLFAFAPKIAYITTAKLYKSLQFKIQTRQLRLSHQDEHFCATEFKYMKQYAVKFKDFVTLLHF